MSFGAEMAELVREMLQTDDDFGSLLTWQHVTKVEDASTGAVASVPTDEAFRGAVADPVRLRVFSESSVAAATTAVIVPAGVLTTEPKLEDKVSLQPGRYLQVIELKAIYGPGDSGPPVLIAHVAAVGG